MEFDPILTYRDELERRADVEADVHEAAVCSIEARRLRRELERLPSLERRVLGFRYGLQGSPSLSRREVARRLGVSLGKVRELERSALEPLRRGYGVDLGEAA
jgi:DNA-directed RNA polymerase sigma subunit (sigma70/sigma32)